MKKILLFVILLTSSQLLYSQRYSLEVDSLLTIAQGAPVEKQPEKYNEISRILKYSNPEAAMEYSLKAIEIAKTTNNPLQKSIGYNFTAICLRKLGKLTESMDYFLKGLNVAVENKIENQTAWCYRNMGNSFNYIGNYNKAIEYISKAIEIGENENDYRITANSYNEIGESYNGLKQFELAKEYIFKSLKIKEEKGMPKLQLILGYKSLGRVYYNQEKYDSSKYYYKKCLGYKDSLDYDMLSELYIDMAKLYYRLGYNDSTLIYCQNSRICAKETHAVQYYSMTYGIIGDLFYNEGNYEDAAANYIHRMKLHDSIFGMELPLKLFNIQYKSDRYTMQRQIETVTYDRKQQEVMLIIIFAVIVMGIILSIIINRNSKHIRQMNNQLNQQQRLINDAINYASKIQNAVLPKKEEISGIFKDKFVFFKKKNVVSGVFYWMLSKDSNEMFALADCTGERVHSACLSMLGTSVLREIADSLDNPSEILENMRKQIKILLHQNDNTSLQQDGMRIALIAVEKNTRTVRYSGSYIPLYYTMNNEVKRIDAVNSLIGISADEQKFSTHTVKLSEGDIIYLSTEGYCSQKHKEKKEVFGPQRFEDTLSKIKDMPMGAQQKKLKETFNKWKGSAQQTDDVCVIGLKL